MHPDLALRLAEQRQSELTQLAAQSRMARMARNGRRPAPERIRSIRRLLAA